MMDGMRNQNGFTLIEILVSIVVLSIGVLGSTRLLISLTNVDSLNKRLTVASTLLQDRIENVKKLGYPNINTSLFEDYGSISNYESYKRITTINHDIPSLNMKTITVTVYWNRNRNSTMSRTILAE